MGQQDAKSADHQRHRALKRRGEIYGFRVLNNESGVSQRTRERVEAVMNQHGFSPSRSARAMRGQSDKVVAIIVTRLDSLSENLAVQTMLPAFYEQGYDQS